MQDAAALACRARFLLPLSDPDRSRRIEDGYVLAAGSTIEGVPYTVENPAPMAQAPLEVVARCKPPGERACMRSPSRPPSKVPQIPAITVTPPKIVPAWPELMPCTRSR